MEKELLSKKEKEEAVIRKWIKDFVDDMSEENNEANK